MKQLHPGKLVELADRRAGAGVDGASYLGWLYGALHIPETFLSDIPLSPSVRGLGSDQ